MLFSVCLLTSCYLPLATGETYIRLNQVGYTPLSSKVAVVISDHKLDKFNFFLLDAQGNRVFKSKLKRDLGAYLAFEHHYLADFSKFQKSGSYTLHVEKSVSPPFQISTSVYKPLTRDLLGFLKTQRCGDTDPDNHTACHLSDATSIVGRQPGIAPDLKGGWHDAGDYIKFTLTTSHTVYMFLLTYEINRALIPDYNQNGLSDILDEAKIGLDWLMKMHYRQDDLLVQVQDLQDHSVGWRLPENDPLVNKRPAYRAPSKTYCGSFSAAMALGASIFRELGDISYADKCLTHAKQVYALSQTDIPDFATGPDSMYYDKTSWDNLALAAIEMYRTTGTRRYLKDAKKLIDENDPIDWMSWGDVGGLAYARSVQYHHESKLKLEETLLRFETNVDLNPFGYPFKSFLWGSLSSQTGIGILAVLYNYYTGSKQFNSIAERQRDFVLGCNQHGVSFVVGYGSVYPQHLHHQVAYLQGIVLKGAVAGGLITPGMLKRQNIKLERQDIFTRFQSSKAVYHDDRNDYLSNEPTIAANAQTLFLYAWFSK